MLQRLVVWLKRISLLSAILMLAGYSIYATDWFQKKYVYPFPYRDIVYQYALEYNVNPYLIAAVIRTESKFNPYARSPKGAVGLMQIMPETAAWIATQVEYPEFENRLMRSPEVNIYFGTWYLSSLKKEFHNNEVLFLAAYNGGRGNVGQWMQKYGWDDNFQKVEQIPFRETREYVAKVLRDQKRYQELYGK